MKQVITKDIQVHILALIIFLLASFIFFYPQFQNKVLAQADSVQYNAMVKEAVDVEKSTGHHILWTGSLFSGMPTFQLSAPQQNNLLKYFEPLLNLYFDRPMGIFLMGLICFYITLCLLKVPPGIAIIGALTFAYSTGIITLLEAGHMSKLRVLSLSTPIIAGLTFIFRNKYFTGALLYSLFFGLSIRANHPQMTYYLGMGLMIYFFIHVFLQFRSRNFLPLSKQIGVLAICTLIAMGSSASKLITTYEYSKSTMRGGSALAQDIDKEATTASAKGLDWEYAMNWSNGYKDLLPTYIPMAMGGSTMEVLKQRSPLIQMLPQYKSEKFPLYWGELPSTSGPFYFGAVVFLLFVFSTLIVKNHWKWWLTSAVIMTFLISLGSNLEWFNRALYNYLPFFNKFRTPNSVLAVTGIFMSTLMALGLKEIVFSNNKKSYLKPLYQSFGALGGLALILWIAGPSIFEFSSSYDSMLGQYVDAMKQTRIDYLKSSALRTILFMGLSTFVIAIYLRGRIKETMMLSLIGALAFVDLLGIGKQYINESTFVPKRKVESAYTPRPVDLQIKQDPDPHYRILDLSVSTFNDAIPSYHHKNVGGYNPAKLSRYQDMIDQHIGKGFQPVLNMLNTKYIIVKGQDEKEMAQYNPQALGNAWFIDEIQMAYSNNEEIDALNRIDPGVTAVLHSDFENYTNKRSFSSSGQIGLKSYFPDKMVYYSKTDSEAFAVFSEVWYTPGWQAYINNKPVDHVRVNYILRGLIVPPGESEIVFHFKPKSYLVGEMISLICSSLIILLLLIVVGLYYRNYKKTTAWEII